MSPLTIEEILSIFLCIEFCIVQKLIYFMNTTFIGSWWSFTQVLWICHLTCILRCTYKFTTAVEIFRGCSCIRYSTGGYVSEKASVSHIIPLCMWKHSFEWYEKVSGKLVWRMFRKFRKEDGHKRDRKVGISMSPEKRKKIQGKKLIGQRRNEKRRWAERKMIK